MTVKELIDVLSRLNPDLPVMVSDIEDGLKDVTNAEPIVVHLNGNKPSWGGPHREGYDSDEGVVPAIHVF